MDTNFLKTQWDVFWSAPLPTVLFLAVGAFGAWWLKGTVDRGQIEGLKAKHDALEERVRLASDKVQPTVEAEALETDDKGNVKPPSTPIDPQINPEPDSGSDQFTWLFRMESAYRSDDCLSTAEQYYNKLKAAPATFPLPLIEAEYLRARFRCGDTSALSELKTLSGPRTDAYFANTVLGSYYESLGEHGAALKCLEDRYAHSTDMDRKLYSALGVAELLAKIDRLEKSLSFLTDQLSVFSSADAHALIWEKLGVTYGLKKMEWRKQLCFEKSLMYNPDNTQLRFSLAYSYGDSSYGQAMAAHHYKFLGIQTPRNSIVFNNLSVIYDEIGAVATKIALLQGAQRRKDSGFVSANLARAYAKAGFLADAREALKDVPAHEQQEEIVQGAYRTIKEESKSDDEVSERLERLIKLQRSLIERNALMQVSQSDVDILQQFVGEWQLEAASILKIWIEHAELKCSITTESNYYEYATYKIITRYQPGLLELHATLDESSLRLRPESKEITGTGGQVFGAFGGTAGNALLLSRAMNRPDGRVILVLMPGESASLYGIKATSFTSEDETKETQLMLNSQEIHLTRRE